MKSTVPISTCDFVYNRQLSSCSDRFTTLSSYKRFSSCFSTFSKVIPAHYGCVNAIEFSNGSETFLASGSDDRRVLLWNVCDLLVSDDKIPKLICMKAEHLANIFCLAFTADSQALLSAGCDAQVIVHDLTSGRAKDVFSVDNAIYSLSMVPESDCLLCTAGDDGQILLFDLRSRDNDALPIAQSKSQYQSAMFNPAESTLIISTNTRDGVQLWDTRKPKRLLKQYKVPDGTRSAMSARWNETGDLILVLRRRQLPSVYHIANETPSVYFDEDGSYFNSCTLKSCTFGGPNDQFVLAGSDNFDCFVWRLPDHIARNKNDPSTVVDKADLTLTGHRSIVNQVRYSKTNQLIATSGVEKTIRLWSCWPMTNAKGGLGWETSTSTETSPKRELMTNVEYNRMLSLRLDGGVQLVANVDGRDNTNEDANMLAFFDNIVQSEVNRYQSVNSESDSSTSSQSMTRNFASSGRRSEISHSQYSNEVVSLPSSLETSDDENVSNGQTELSTCSSNSGIRSESDYNTTGSSLAFRIKQRPWNRKLAIDSIDNYVRSIDDTDDLPSTSQSAMLNNSDSSMSSVTSSSINNRSINQDECRSTVFERRKLTSAEVAERVNRAKQEQPSKRARWLELRHTVAKCDDVTTINDANGATVTNNEETDDDVKFKKCKRTKRSSYRRKSSSNEDTE